MTSFEIYLEVILDEYALIGIAEFGIIVHYY